MTEDKDRHADEVNIAFQMGAEWQKKQSDSAWKGIHEGAVLAMQARINELEAALEDALQYVSRADWHYLKDETRKALEKNDANA
jgi:hypothetical protein